MTQCSIRDNTLNNNAKGGLTNLKHIKFFHEKCSYDYTFDVFCHNINDLFKNLNINFSNSHDIDNDNDNMFKMNDDKLKECLTNGIHTVRYTKNSANIIIDQCDEKPPVFGISDINGTKKIVNRSSLFDRLIRVFLDMHYSIDVNSDDSTKHFCQSTPNYEQISKNIGQILRENKHSTTPLSDYTGYHDIYLKTMVDNIIRVTHTNMGMLFDILKQLYKKKSPFENEINNNIETNHIQADLSNIVLEYCFEYNAILLKNVPVWINNDNMKDCNKVMICIKISQNNNLTE